MTPRPNPDRASRKAIVETIAALRVGETWPISRDVFRASFDTLAHFRQYAPNYSATDHPLHVLIKREK